MLWETKLSRRGASPYTGTKSGLPSEIPEKQIVTKSAGKVSTASNKNCFELWKWQSYSHGIRSPSPGELLRLYSRGAFDHKYAKEGKVNTLNSNQKTLKRMIQDTKLQISDEELFLSAAFQKHQTSLAKAATGRSRYGLQVITNWDTSEDAGVAYTDNYKIHCNAGNPITQSFPSRFLRALSISGFTGQRPHIFDILILLPLTSILQNWNRGFFILNHRK